MEPHLCLRAPVMRDCQHSQCCWCCVSEGGFGLVVTTAISTSHVVFTSCCLLHRCSIASWVLICWVTAPPFPCSHRVGLHDMNCCIVAVGCTKEGPVTCPSCGAGGAECRCGTLFILFSIDHQELCVLVLGMLLLLQCTYLAKGPFAMLHQRPAHTFHHSCPCINVIGRC